MVVRTAPRDRSPRNPLKGEGQLTGKPAGITSPSLEEGLGRDSPGPAGCAHHVIFGPPTAHMDNPRGLGYFIVQCTKERGTPAGALV